MSQQYPGGPPSSDQPQQPTGATPPPPPPGQAPPPPPPGQAGAQAPYGQAPYGQQPYGQAPQQPHGMPYAPQQPPMGSQVGQPADLGTRFLARFIDLILVGIVSGIVTSIFGAAAFSSILTTGSINYGTLALTTVVNTAIIVGYFVLMETSRGQTLGKMLMKIKTFGPGGANPTPVEALKRNAWTGLGIIGVIPMIGWLGSLLYLAAAIYIAVTINNNTATRQGWHDTFAGGTTVIKVG